MSHYRPPVAAANSTSNSTVALLSRITAGKASVGARQSGNLAGNGGRSFAGSVHRVTSEVLKIGENGQLYGVSAVKSSASRNKPAHSRWTPGSSLKTSRLAGSMGIRPKSSSSANRTITPYLLAAANGGTYDTLRRHHRPHSAQVSSKNPPSKFSVRSSAGAKRRPKGVCPFCIECL